jgi:hypothetical protein
MTGRFRTLQEKSFLVGLPTDAALDARTGDVRFACVLPFVLHEPWRSGDAATRLYAAYFRDTRTPLRAFVAAEPVDLPTGVDAAGFAAIARRHRAALLDFGAPFMLEPVHVAKPWGREIWFTGYETRGVCRVIDGHGSTPLPWALASAPRRLCGERPVVLLKVLESAPTPVLGELYLESHETKREVYVVTGLDANAWPNGVGAIRYGVDQRVRERYGDDATFRAAFAAAVKRYENVRRTIDAEIDAGRAPDASLVRREAELRAAMNEFTTVHPLMLEDVVCVPTHTPHSLQHGARVIELQTPVYERQILSFPQKVLTQSHWDTGAAIRAMRLDQPTPEPIERTEVARGVTRERIAALDDFVAFRYRIAPAASHDVHVGGAYAIAIGVTGETRIDGTMIGVEKACMVPGTMRRFTLNNRSSGEATVLLAEPTDE